MQRSELHGKDLGIGLIFFQGVMALPYHIYVVSARKMRIHDMQYTFHTYISSAGCWCGRHFYLS